MPLLQGEKIEIVGKSAPGALLRDVAECDKIFFLHFSLCFGGKANPTIFVRKQR